MENNFDGKSFVSKISETISTKGKEVSYKAKDLAEIAALKSQIRGCEDTIRRNYIELGKLYYERQGAEPEEAYEEYCKAVSDARNSIKELEDKIKDIRCI